MGDHTLSGPTADLTIVSDRFRAVNGDHPMTEADDAYAREHFAPADPAHLADIAAGRLPLPAYLLGDGTPMVADVGECIGAAGGVDSLPDWFLAFWPDDPATGQREWEEFLTGQHFYVQALNPVSIRRTAHMIEQARAAAVAVRADPHDEIAQGSLAEAVDGSLSVAGLDELLLPLTPYDRLRVAGPTVRDLWVDALRAEFHDPQPPPLPIQTERLTLRRRVLDDAAASARAWADEDFARYLLHPTRSEAEVRFETYQRVNSSHDGSHRVLGLTLEHEGASIGSIVLFFQGTGVHAAEIGWDIYPWAAGQGFATEAAQAMLEVAFEHYGVRRVVANLDALNLPSAALAERLGMRREADKIGDFWSKGRWTDSYDYAILRSEWQSRRSTSA